MLTNTLWPKTVSRGLLWLLDNIGVLFEEGTDLLLGRDGLARKDPSLSLLDDLVQQLQIVGQLRRPGQTEGIAPLRRRGQRLLGIVGRLGRHPRR